MIRNWRNSGRELNFEIYRMKVRLTDQNGQITAEISAPPPEGSSRHLQQLIHRPEQLMRIQAHMSVAAPKAESIGRTWGVKGQTQGIRTIERELSRHFHLNLLSNQQKTELNAFLGKTEPEKLKPGPTGQDVLP